MVPTPDSGPPEPKPEKKQEIINGKPFPPREFASEAIDTIDASQIPVGYGIVPLQDNEGTIITNNIGDVRLFIDPKLRHMSSLELKEIPIEKFFLSGLDNLPPEYRRAFEGSRMPTSFYIIKSPEDTELVYAIGKGTNDDPFRVIVKTMQVVKKDSTFVHLALMRRALITGEEIQAYINDVLFKYMPTGDGGGVYIEASCYFRPPRSFEKIDADMNTEDESITGVEISYYKWILEHPDEQLSPVEWCKTQYTNYGIRHARRIISMVRERIENGNL